MLEAKVKNALIYFGPMDRQQISGKLYMLDITVDPKDLEVALNNLIEYGYVRESDIDKRFFVARELL